MEPNRLVCASQQMIKIAETIRLSRGRNLLLTGETGVGKDVLARWAHSISEFADGPFVEINCAAIQHSLWESEIFGHGRGAFTGAHRDKPGQVELAHEGTLFLNEIGEMPLTTQSKLLTFLDTGEFQRVGETDKRRVVARVISATNRDLKAEVEAGSFRRDLFYRLGAVQAHIPPLRERPADVLALASQHLKMLGKTREVPPVHLTEKAREGLLNCPWKGNVRELQSVLDSAFERCLEAKTVELLPEHLSFDLEIVELRDEERVELMVPESDAPRPLTQENAQPMPDGYTSNSSRASTPKLRTPDEGILDDPDALKDFLDQFQGATGRWNISAAYRSLVQAGQIEIGRRAFAHRLKQMFPDA